MVVVQSLGNWDLCKVALTESLYGGAVVGYSQRAYGTAQHLPKLAGYRR